MTLMIEPALVATPILFALGASLGSFLAAAAYRIPREISLLRPSECTVCGARIGLFGLVPVLGYLLVRGRCASCHQRFSPHYAFFELLMGLLTVYCVEAHVGVPALMSLATGTNEVLGRYPLGFAVPLLTALWILYSGGLLSLIDLEFRILPDVITVPGVAVGLTLTAFDPERLWFEGLLGAAVGGLGLWAVAVIYRLLRGRDGMGLGDVKYLAMVGAALGWTGVLWCLLIGSCLGSVFGMGLALFTRKGLQTAIPFGPFLAVGALLYALHGNFFDGVLLGAP
jgi:leader peptidase (prepilin peptidase)/N-methyltransferase